MTLTYPNQYGQPQPAYPGPAAVGHPGPPQAPAYAPGQQFVQPTPATAPVPTPPGLGFQDPARQVGSGNPAPRHLVGRTIVMVPKRVDENAKYDNQSRPTAYVDLYVIDGGQIIYGDSEDRTNPRPPTHSVDTPCFFPNAMIGNDAFVNEIRSKLGPGGVPTGLSVGVVVKPSGKRYYAMTRCETDENNRDRPDGAQRRAAAQDVYMRHQAGEWTPPVPTPLGQMAPPAAPPVNYAQQGQAPYQGAAYAPQPQAAPQGWNAPESHAYGAYGPPQSAPPAPVGIPPAPGWENNPAWGQFTPEQQASIWQQSTQSASGAPASSVTAPPPAPVGQAGPGW